MKKDKSSLLFNIIAPVYGLFYESQKKRYKRIIDDVKSNIDISSFNTIIDIGCGTGALSSVLDSKGMKVTGVDLASRMIDIAIKKNKNTNIEFLKGNVLSGLPFEDNRFDIAIASYVAHGLEAEERKIMYREMGRVTKDYVIIHDYNKERAVMTSIIEYLEGGDYFNFIERAQSEMEVYFKSVEVIRVDKRANWYICRTN